MATLFFEAEEKLALSAEAFDNKQWGDSIYFSYAAFINGAKGLLLDKQVHVNTQHLLISDFDKTFVDTGLVQLGTSFSELILQINKHDPSAAFSETYFSQASAFLTTVKNYRESQIKAETNS